VGRDGQPRDGILRLHDIYNLRWNADLVVLSACQTALGQQIRGEGMVGLTRGFMHAGAPRVAATLWKVDDQATARLMQYFYEGLLGPRHLAPAAARRAEEGAPWHTENPYVYFHGVALNVLREHWRAPQTQSLEDLPGASQPAVDPALQQRRLEESDSTDRRMACM